ncbi:penicillin-binding protein activator [Methylobacillus flagellatus]|uniref:penicillin-binding protein activator n=1 Tax=Methylobacillus flagellatus TaxID=405 RepID=UPI0014850489|nr:penicillin-binding protein activator [Methylobacillus flagellatus]
MRVHNSECAQLALQRINSQSIYADLLAGNIAASTGDTDTILPLLEPLQNHPGLRGAALASLHQSLGIAYAAQQQPLKALEQYTLSEAALSEPAAIAAQQQRTGRLLASLSREDLMQMSSDATDKVMQGWIALALTISDIESDDPVNTRLQQWRTHHREHPAQPEYAFGIVAVAESTETAIPSAIDLEGSAARQLDEADQETASQQSARTESASLESAGQLSGLALTRELDQRHLAASTGLDGDIALLLPYETEGYTAVADAIERGFIAAHSLAHGLGKVRTYATNGDALEIRPIYQQALKEGATMVVGPVTRDEVAALQGDAHPVLTLGLNQNVAAAPPLFHSYGLSIHSEVTQLVRMARDAGMQTATIIASNSPLAQRISTSFKDQWLAQGGEVRDTIVVDADSTTSPLIPQGSAAGDLYLIAGDEQHARAVRPLMDRATPTFALSHSFSGILQDPLDADLIGIRFVDIPWLLNPHNPAYQPYKAAAAELPPGEMQRWFALGVDAYQLLLALQQAERTLLLPGLTGRITRNAQGELERRLATGTYTSTGVSAETLP